MNKGLEVIEAKVLFDMPYDKIDVLLHRESIIHSMVEYEDTSVIAQLGTPDMRVPIQYALSWPQRLEAKRARLDLSAIGKLTFRAPDERRFPCLKLVKQACETGGCATAILAAADEWAVKAFLEGRIGYLDIANTVERCLENAPTFRCDSLDSIMEANDWVWRFL